MLDENIDVRVGRKLHAWGYAVVSCPKGATDEDVLAIAKRDGLVLVTNDTDFTNLPSDTLHALAGLIVFRIHPPDVTKTAKALEKLLQEVGDEIQSTCILLGEEGFTVV